MQTVPPEKYGVHRTHCCILHGCKYGNADCPVALAKVEQDYNCESCDNDAEFRKPVERYEVTVGDSQPAVATEMADMRKHVYNALASGQSCIVQTFRRPETELFEAPLPGPDEIN